MLTVQKRCYKYCRYCRYTVIIHTKNEYISGLRSTRDVWCCQTPRLRQYVHLLFYQPLHSLSSPSPPFLSTIFPPEPSTSSPSSSLFLSSLLRRRPRRPSTPPTFHPHGMISSPAFQAVPMPYLLFSLDSFDFAAAKPFLSERNRQEEEQEEGVERWR